MKIVTATGMPEINERLKQESDFEVIGCDIQYHEGVLEILEEREDIEGIILSNNLIDEMDFNILILKILELNKNIEITVFLKEKDISIEMFLNSKKIYKIYYLYNFEAFFENLNKKEMSNQDISKNIEDFKRIIYQEKEVLNVKEEYTENINNQVSSNYINYKDTFENNNKSIVCFSGSYGVGKSIISILFAKYISKKAKVLLIDCDYSNKSINAILGISKLPKNYKRNNLLDAVVKYRNNLYVLSALDMFTDDFKANNNGIFVKAIEELKTEFDFIIIDTSSDFSDSKNNIIFSYSSQIVFLIEPNLLEVKKANRYLEIMIKDYGIKEDKVNIVFNKVNKYQINDRVLNEIYSENNIIGKIDYNEKCNLIINKNSIKEEYCNEEVFEKILK